MQSSKSISFGTTSLNDENEKTLNILWDEMSPTLESMTFSNDDDLVEKDTLEVLDYLPDYKGKRILELNAGIGRFTGLMAKDAAHVTAVDLILKMLDLNKKENHKYDNITFLCADATKLDFPEGSFDLVFSGWLYTNVGNDSVKTITEHSLKWLSPGGHIFFRESSRDIGYIYKPASYAFYRRQLEYCQLLQNVKYAEACFGNIRTKTSLLYLQKLICEGALGQGEYVLNLGCGTGGEAFLLAEHYGVDVHAVDLSSNMIGTAMGRHDNLDNNLRNKILFEAADITETEFQEASYDAIYSCNSIFRFKEKQNIFSKLYRLLKPGGKLFIADFCKGNCKDELQELLNNFSINLISIKDYEMILKDSGFGDIRAKDESENLSRVLQKDLKGFNTTKDTFVEEFSMNEFCDLVKWATKALNWVDSKELAWGFFTASKC